MAQFKGFKQVILATYEALEASAKTGYVWFVRPDSASTYGDIYVGSRRYGHYGNEASEIANLQALVGAGFTGKTLTEKIDELSGVEVSGAIVWATEEAGVYTEVTEGTTGAQKYLKLSIGSGDPVYILTSELVSLDGYATTAQLAEKADSAHTHDDRYYTEQEVDALLSGITSNVKADWNAAAGSDAEILNKPTLFSGDYEDLTNKPQIPSISGLATEQYVDNAVSGKSDVNHTHEQYSLTGHTHDEYALSGHTHDMSDYYTTGQVDTFLAGKSDTGHTHVEYALSGHTHDMSAYALASALADKQDALTAGTGITIAEVGGVLTISAAPAITIEGDDIEE